LNDVHAGPQVRLRDHQQRRQQREQHDPGGRPPFVQLTAAIDGEPRQGENDQDFSEFR